MSSPPDPIAAALADRDGHATVRMKNAIRAALQRRRYSTEDVEEYFQQAALQALAAKSFDPKKGRVDTWLCQIATNVVKHDFRKLAARGTPCTLPPELVDQKPLASPRDAIEERERLTKLQTLVGTLPARDQQIIWLKYRDGLHAEEIGRRLGMKAGNVRVRQYRILQELQSHNDLACFAIGGQPLQKREYEHRLDGIATRYLQAIEAEDFDSICDLWGKALDSDKMADMLYGLNAEIVAELDSDTQEADDGSKSDKAR